MFDVYCFARGLGCWASGYCVLEQILYGLYRQLRGIFELVRRRGVSVTEYPRVGGAAAVNRLVIELVSKTLLLSVTLQKGA